MTDGSRSPVSLRQVLWIAAGAAILTFLIAVASWLFSPRSPQDAEGVGASSIQEATVEKKSFSPEPPSPGRLKGQESRQPAVREEDVPPTPPVPAGEGSLAPESPRATAGPGTTTEPAPPSPPAPTGSAARTGGEADLPYGIQVGAFSSASNAQQIKHRLDASGYRSAILDKGLVHKVVVTGFPDRAAAEKALADLRLKGFPKAFIVRVE